MKYVILILATLLLGDNVKSSPRFTPPSVHVFNLDDPCPREPHAHADEDIRYRAAVIIGKVDACGFTYETRTETGRLSFDPECVVAYDGAEVGGKVTAEIVGRGEVKSGKVAQVFFCTYCKAVLAVKLQAKGAK